MNQPYPARTLLGALAGLQISPPRRKIFISYHHGNDQPYYDALSNTLHDQMDLVFDNSLDRRIDSENTDYVIQRIRDSFISGTSCTLVLCGPGTYQRKYVDWEIKATLDKGHGLIGLALPTITRTQQGLSIVPDRLHQNIVSGYALWKSWGELTANPRLVNNWIEEAMSREASTIINPQAIKARNG